jgi:hypothetical protein
MATHDWARGFNGITTACASVEPVPGGLQCSHLVDGRAQLSAVRRSLREGVQYSGSLGAFTSRAIVGNNPLTVR